MLIILMSCVVPGPCKSLKVQVTSTNFLEVAWTPPTQPNGVIQGYQLGWQGINGLTLSNKAIGPRLDASLRKARIDGLKPKSSYRLYVWAFTSVGNGDSIYVDAATSAAARMLASIQLSFQCPFYSFAYHYASFHTFSFLNLLHLFHSLFHFVIYCIFFTPFFIF